MAFEGRCLCGAVTFSSVGSPVFMGNCYCSDCRRESGTGHITAVAVPEATLTVRGETREFVKPADSGETITNVFCPVCATTLFTRPSGLPGLALLRAGTLDDPTAVNPQVNMYVAAATKWDRPVAGLHDFVGMASGV
ncbi:hypothetical protein FHS31_000210 [Sphingomonas vulcanisoli]|uniref:CENP-V/GFA domain-containing protein n=1 Tax=Sphingomonas vulcanisoli TaxID=1658060 RepID=A0ABX0TM80_9SPHN|nr:GFA family protein [Sphingomonas vulcanisoli]NIJ06628.1 hypothetical protein [Sphingomonas vulcanisoli]